MKKVLLTILFFSYYLSPHPAKADETILSTDSSMEVTALTIMPSVFENVLRPGEATTSNFELKNNSQFPLPIKCYVRNFEASDETGGVSINDVDIDARRFAPQNWIHINSPDFVIQPQTSHQINIQFNPPKDIPPGGYYAILFTEPLLPQSFLSGNSLQIGGRIGALLFSIAPGDIVEKGNIASIHFPKYIYQMNDLLFRFRFQNTGNVHLRPQGKILLTNRITKKTQSFDIPEFTVLPGKIRQQDIPIQIKWPGLYQLESQLQYGNERRAIKHTTKLTYLPLSLLFVTLVLIIFVIAIFTSKIRKRTLIAIRTLIKG